MADYLIAHIGHTTKWCEHITWWKPDSRGYTVCIDKAGLYGEDEARSICQSSLCIAVRKPAAAELAKTTPYYRAPGGELRLLYDGGPHVVVPNLRPSWDALLATRLDGGKPDRPTPIGAKSRAIHVPADWRPIEAARKEQQP